MPRKPVSEMSPEEREANRAYMREAKRKSRARIPEGYCITGCGNRTRKTNGRFLATCAECNERSHKWDEEQGYPIRPSTVIKRQARKLRRQGASVNEIVTKLKPVGADRQRVSDVLREAGLL